MNSEALKNLPPEMQQRLAEIMQQQQSASGVEPRPVASSGHHATTEAGPYKMQCIKG